jgi:SEC-C motif-containing protein
MKCPCGSNVSFSACCNVFLTGERKPISAESLMRSRYSAYVVHAIPYLLQTTHVSVRNFYRKKELEEWSKNSNWLKLEIISSQAETVEFKAYFTAGGEEVEVHHEIASFVFENGRWYYVDAIYPDN